MWTSASSICAAHVLAYGRLSPSATDLCVGKSPHTLAMLWSIVLQILECSRNGQPAPFHGQDLDGSPRRPTNIRHVHEGLRAFKKQYVGDQHRYRCSPCRRPLPHRRKAAKTGHDLEPWLAQYSTLGGIPIIWIWQWLSGRCPELTPERPRQKQEPGSKDTSDVDPRGQDKMTCVGFLFQH